MCIKNFFLNIRQHKQLVRFRLQRKKLFPCLTGSQSRRQSPLPKRREVCTFLRRRRVKLLPVPWWRQVLATGMRYDFRTAHIINLLCTENLLKFCIFQFQKGENVPVTVQVGDSVLLPEYGGTKVELEEKEYFLYREHDILAKIKE